MHIASTASPHRAQIASVSHFDHPPFRSTMPSVDALVFLHHLAYPTFRPTPSSVGPAPLSVVLARWAIPGPALALPAEDDDDDEHRLSPPPPPPTPLPKGPQREDQDVRATLDAWPTRAPWYVADTTQTDAGLRVDASQRRKCSSSGQLSERSWFGVNGEIVVSSSSSSSARLAVFSQRRHRSHHADKAPHAHRHFALFLVPRRPQGSTLFTPHHHSTTLLFPYAACTHTDKA
ncbi:hypothetical protein B0H15DRAFT_950781 [Mycena belliarum]|uniref:Uncharacterized protein n=1 Tax=Mycena belliarum TaxID=1033014 RepID=A0AAD6U0K4_9AGAR|nr:hypothetical protein B0H15DRAFT_950781 [Mycena belliae]